MNEKTRLETMQELQQFLRGCSQDDQFEGFHKGVVIPGTSARDWQYNEESGDADI